MLFNYIDTLYACLVIILLVGFLFIKKQWNPLFSNLISVSNTLLIFYAFYLISSFIDLIRLALSLNIQPPKNAPTPSIGWFEIKYLLLMILPFFFLIKKLAKSKIAACVMVALLQWDILVMIYNKLFTNQTTASFIFYITYNIEIKVAHFICLFIGTYALLWLLKRLPSQQVK